MSLFRQFRLSVVAAVALSFGITAPGYGSLIITPTFDSTITGDGNSAAIINAINEVIGVYGAKFNDPINVSIKFQSANTGLGGSSTSLYKLDYQTFINALIADNSSPDDITALANLPNGAINPVTGSTSINVNTANIRALGIAGYLPGSGFDGVITLNTHLTDIGSPGTTGQYDLKSVAFHEINEVLGLGSDLGQTNPFFNDPAPEDLYRYNGAGNRSYTIDPNAVAFFSIDGITSLAEFNNKNNGGDWGDWRSNPLPNGVQPKVQDAYATVGAHPTLGVELRALDVIGYNLTEAVPEPGTLSLSGTMLAVLGCLARRRTRKARQGLA
jgi:hypothetical protein